MGYWGMSGLLAPSLMGFKCDSLGGALGIKASAHGDFFVVDEL